MKQIDKVVRGAATVLSVGSRDVCGGCHHLIEIAYHSTRVTYQRDEVLSSPSMTSLICRKLTLTSTPIVIFSSGHQVAYEFSTHPASKRKLIQIDSNPGPELQLQLQLQFNLDSSFNSTSDSKLWPPTSSRQPCNIPPSRREGDESHRRQVVLIRLSCCRPTDAKVTCSAVSPSPASLADLIVRLSNYYCTAISHLIELEIESRTGLFILF